MDTYVGPNRVVIIIDCVDMVLGPKREGEGVKIDEEKRKMVRW